MKRILLGVGLSVCLWVSGTIAFAQGADLPPEAARIVPSIKGPQDIIVGRTIILDASETQGLGEKTTYRWYRDRSAQSISQSFEAVFTPERTGTITFRVVIRTTIDGKEYEAEKEHTVVVYERKVILITDASAITEEKLAFHKQEAALAGTYLLPLWTETTGASTLSSIDTLSSLVTANAEALAGAQAVVVWSDDAASGLQALMKTVDASGESLLQKQTLVMITGRSLNILARMSSGPFAVLKPDRIILTRQEALSPLLTTKTIPDFTEELVRRDLGYRIIDESTTGVRPWNLLSSLVTYMLTHGVSSQIVILLLILPLIAMILAFLRQVVGITTFGLFTPSIITLSFLAIGWKAGIVYLLLILIAGYSTRAIMQRWELLHVPRMAVVLSVVSVTLLLLLGTAAAFHITYERDTVFILLIMSTLAESFLSLKAEEGWRSAMIATTETIFAALLCVWVVQWPLLQSLILAYPELILLAILADIALGRWSGLRLVEYFRFREVIGHLHEE
ncbi:MAG: 7TM domain-containing protein [Candidatus Peribacteraceae bacterium]|nr:7TM domain-containing protein [Candidatus Peribacteraceae bacterium]